MTAYGVGDSFWDIVGSAEWAATVGLPLGVTLGSIGAAYVLVRRQIRHDRELAAAQRRADAASRLGAALIALHDQFESTAFDDEWWRMPGWSGWSALYDAVREAEIVLDEKSAFEFIEDAGRCVSHGWAACYNHARLLRRAKSAVEVGDLGVAMHTALADHVVRLFEIGKHLIRWDGHGTLPLSALPPFDRVPLPSNVQEDEYQRWCASVQAEFKACLQDALTRDIR
ncbi:MAG TPA: hypothetical protein VNA20_17320 [Frankiaceae bacterium]|nr:hypothetical protein [Frankiaceae bacterium]